MKRTLLILFAWASLVQIGNSQCTTSSPFGSATLPTDGTVVVISGCTFSGDYVTLFSSIIGNTYVFICTEDGSGIHKYITITDESNVVLVHGMSPLSWIATVAGTLRGHYTQDAACTDLDFYCHLTTVQCTSCILPIELLSFSGEESGRSNKLTWKTATEQNTEMHIIERSATGMDWETVGELPAAGFSNETLSYELFDRAPLMKSYYRLKSVDYDGYTDYSKVITIQRDQVIENEIAVFPNPFTNDLSVAMQLTKESFVNIEVYAPDGRYLQSQNYDGVAGSNSFIVPSDNLQVGLYLLKINYDDQAIIKRIVKK